MKHRRAGGDQGAFTLSYVIIFPVLLLALMLITQTALLYLARQAALAAARQGADAARVQHAAPGAGTTAALAFARTVSSGYLRSPAVSATVSNQTVQITVTGQAPSLVPGVALHVGETVQVPVERFTTP